MSTQQTRSYAAKSLLARALVMGPRESTQRIARRAVIFLADRFDKSGLDFPLLPGDVADSTSMVRPTPIAPNRGPGMKLAWLCTPPSAGSGGHTTFFRMIRGMEERGHRCTIFLYSRHGGDLERQRATIRSGWPELVADVEVVPQELAGFDAYIASSWETAHVLAVRAPGRHGGAFYYFIQDYEPYFYPRGSLYALAEDSYRFGFTHLALGEMVASMLRREVGVPAEVIPYGSDLSGYGLRNTGPRSGVVFFARPGVDRRGYELGRLALIEFHRLHPEQEIHVFGSKVRGWGIPLTQHGVLSVDELNSLYNRTSAGLALSFTNITLVAAEMLAAGNIPVLNDHEFSRPMLTNPEAVWASPTPSALANALSSVVSDPDRTSRSARASGNSAMAWAVAQSEMSRIVAGEAAGGPATRTEALP